MYGVAIGTIATGVFVYLATRGGGGEIPACICAGVLLLATWRAAMAGIHVGSGGVKVVGALTTKRVRWEQIEHFTIGPRGVYPCTGHVILRDGRDLWSWGLDAGRRPTAASRKQVEEPIAELNRLLAEQQASSGSAERPVAAD
jgi:hypothetical protein